jgi:nucleoid DNA-binding protein
MHKEEFVKHLAKKYRRSKRHYQEALTEIFGEIKQKLADGKDVRLTGFGTFYTRMHKGGKGRDFKTKKIVEYKPVRLVGFHAGDLLRKAVRRKKGLFSR